jgi:HAD superfamily hydrolase (TIGR01509 family)
MVLQHRTHWIFDMDGTLTLSIHDFEAMRRDLGLPKGMAILEALALLPEAEAAPKRQQLADMELEIARRSQPQPGAIELLETLLANGKTIGILTRNSKLGAVETLKVTGLLPFFAEEAILSRDCCAPKPNPDGIWKLLNQWQASPETSVMVGDYVFDLQTGRAAGTATVHLDTSGLFPWPDQADVKVTDLQTLQELGMRPQ